ncbi:hypothetical protein Poly30_10370 [Planctomycetes bacterium Poly30]|uniref:YcxB-like protein domain-containing protein n=1 Tax=Saltatorellus ferox TaxID=2528018 RepID=A0A518EN84_9BACT|nr:hypothetical protein Poly30_10370 [Planctomycetes bacterium Poly30]
MGSEPIATCRIVRDRAYLEQAFDESVRYRLRLRKHLPKFGLGLGVLTLALMVARPGILSALYFWGSVFFIWHELSYRRRMLALGERSPAYGRELWVRFFPEHLETTENGEPMEVRYADFDRLDVTPGGFLLVSGGSVIFTPKSKIEPPGAASQLEAAIREARLDEPAP